MNILFWNLGRNDNADYVKECLTENDIDIAAFCEHSNTDFKKVISQITSEKYVVVLPDNKKRVQFLIKEKLICPKVHFYDRHVTVQLTTPFKTYSVTGVHLQDRRNSDTEDRIDVIRSIMADVNSFEEVYGISNTIIVGDFNSNPYDDEILRYNAFNAVLFREVIRKSDQRIKNSKKYRRLYNPILNYLSEQDQMYGSYYSATESNTSYWFCLDQILLGPSLIDSVTKLKYIKKIGTKSLINEIQPNDEISDHLPLFIVVNES